MAEHEAQGLAPAPLDLAVARLLDNVDAMTPTGRAAFVAGLDHAKALMLADDAEMQLQNAAVVDALQQVVREVAALLEDSHG